MAAFFSISPSPASADFLRAALISSLHQAHRPELADVVHSADLSLDRRGLWVWPADASLDPGWLEQQLQSAALAGGLSAESIHVLRRPGIRRPFLEAIAKEVLVPDCCYQICLAGQGFVTNHRRLGQNRRFPLPIHRLYQLADLYLNLSLQLRRQSRPNLHIQVRLSLIAP